MTWVFAILIVLALGGVAAAAAGRGSGLAAEDDALARSTTSPAEVPLDADGLRGVRFPLALRGYRMADVDALLDRLARREVAREAERDAERGAHREARAEPPTDR